MSNNLLVVIDDVLYSLLIRLSSSKFCEVLFWDAVKLQIVILLSLGLGFAVTYLLPSLL